MREYAISFTYIDQMDKIKREDCLQCFGLKELKGTIKCLVEQGDTITDIEIRLTNGNTKTLDIKKYIKNSMEVKVNEQ
jgi:hypothetical protein